MSPTLLLMLEHVAVGLLSSSLLGLASNYLIGKLTKPGSKARLFGAAYLTSLPSQVQAVAAELAPGLSPAERVSRLINLLDAEMVAVKMGVAAVTAPPFTPDEPKTRPDMPASLSPPAGGK